jgi:hypothetical protein
MLSASTCLKTAWWPILNSFFPKPDSVSAATTLNDAVGAGVALGEGAGEGGAVGVGVGAGEGAHTRSLTSDPSFTKPCAPQMEKAVHSRSDVREGVALSYCHAKSHCVVIRHARSLMKNVHSSLAVPVMSGAHETHAACTGAVASYSDWAHAVSGVHAVSEVCWVGEP